MKDDKKMAAIKLTNDDFELIFRVLKEENLVKTLEEQKLLNAPNQDLVTVNLDLKDFHTVLDSLTFALTEIGLDVESEPNEIGVKIESLIDKLSSHIY